MSGSSRLTREEAMSRAADELQALTLCIVRALVDFPEDVSVMQNPGAQTVMLAVSTHPSDVGKVIGAKGVNANAIRTLLNAVAGKHRVRFQLDINEDRPVPSTRPRSRPPP
jgi:predicted RNA-binding protein YlqC (UPF0109 family)